MRFSLFLLVFIGACSFDGPSALTAIDGGATDAGGSIDAADRDPECEWNFVPLHNDRPCALALGTSFNLTGDSVVDTDAATLFSNGSSRAIELSKTNNGDGIQIATWIVADLVVSGSLRVEGALPLQLISQSNISVDGMIDLVGNETGRAAGADTTLCDLSVGVAGGPGDGGAAGGGGGSFIGVGGRGDDGDDDGDGSTAGEAGAVAQPAFRGGCSGGNGGERAVGDDSGGAGGKGGGAIHLVARNAITIGGVINAGGGGGSAGVNQSDGGGGGGGSGGYVGLEALAVNLVVGGFVGTNGGGGGGGTSTADNGESAGQSALASREHADGGQGAQSNNNNGGGDGGDGEAFQDPAEEADDDPVGAGGGGGGGAGLLMLITDGGSQEETVFGMTPMTMNLTPLQSRR